MQEELSRTEEELVNARQENTYLADRIKELEDEARAREAQAATVQDSDLANMESSLPNSVKPVKMNHQWQ